MSAAGSAQPEDARPDAEVLSTPCMQASDINIP